MCVCGCAFKFVSQNGCGVSSLQEKPPIPKPWKPKTQLVEQTSSSGAPVSNNTCIHTQECISTKGAKECGYAIVSHSTVVLCI